jgi:hypothetical protein
MPSIQANQRAGNAAIEAGTLKPVPTATPSTPGPPGPRLDPYPASPNPYIRTPLPAISTQQPDQQRNFQSGAVPQDRLIGVPATANPVVSAQTITNIIKAGGNTAGGLLLKTNNQTNAVQNLINFVSGSGIAITSDAQGNETFSWIGSTTSTPQWPLPNTALTFMARAIVGQTGLQTIGDASTAVTSGGTVSISNGAYPTSTLGVAVQVAVADSSGAAFAGWQPINHASNSNGIFTAGRNCKYQARVAVLSGLKLITFLGFSTGDASTLRTVPFGSSIYVGIYTPGTGLPTDTWQATISGSATVDTGVSISGNTYVEIIMDDAANTTSFSVNGSTPVVVSGSNPSGINWSPTISFANNNSTTIDFYLQYMYAQQNF